MHLNVIGFIFFKLLSGYENQIIYAPSSHMQNASVDKLCFQLQDHYCSQQQNGHTNLWCSHQLDFYFHYCYD